MVSLWLSALWWLPALSEGEMNSSRGKLWVPSPSPCRRAGPAAGSACEPRAPPRVPARARYDGEQALNDPWIKDLVTPSMAAK